MREIEYREAIREAVIEEMDRDEKVFIKKLICYYNLCKRY